MDTKAAYLQAQGFDRDIYVRPAHEYGISPGLLWKLTAAAHSLADSAVYGISLHIIPSPRLMVTTAPVSNPLSILPRTIQH